MKKQIVWGLITVILAGLAFYGGIKYQQRQTVSRFAGFSQNGAGSGTNNGQLRARTGMANGANGGAVRGEILSVNDTSPTVKQRDGSSKIVIIGSSTSINKAATGTKTDLTTGAQVAIFGTTNSDGSVTAQNIQLNPVTPTSPPTQ